METRRQAWSRLKKQLDSAAKRKGKLLTKMKGIANGKLRGKSTRKARRRKVGTVADAESGRAAGSTSEVNPEVDATEEGDNRGGSVVGPDPAGLAAGFGIDGTPISAEHGRRAVYVRGRGGLTQVVSPAKERITTTEKRIFRLPPYSRKDGPTDKENLEYREWISDPKMLSATAIGMQDGKQVIEVERWRMVQEARSEERGPAPIEETQGAI